jgi:hypothetical protein
MKLRSFDVVPLLKVCEISHVGGAVNKNVGVYTNDFLGTMCR